MAGRLEGRTTVITGGASGMGLATAVRFLEEGARVVVGDLNEEAGERLAADLAGRRIGGDRFRFRRTDVADEADVAALVATATEAWGGLDVLFNNAGIGGAFGPITEIDADHWDLTFAVLVRSVFLGTKHAARVMVPQGGGVIINTASIAGLAGGGGPQAYSAAKAAVVNLTQNTALELAPHHIRVNAICPGFIFTPLAVGKDEAHAAEVIGRMQPWPEHGQPDDIAGAALFLASDDSAFVTGEALVVDGGLTAAGTRLWSQMDGGRSMRKFTGFGHGTTGLGTTATRLVPPSA